MSSSHGGECWLFGVFSVSKQKIILNVVTNSSANSSNQFCADLVSDYFTRNTLSCSSVVHGAAQFTDFEPYSTDRAHLLLQG